VMFGTSPAQPAATLDRSGRVVERAAWIAVPVVIAIHVWLYRFEMANLDGISYLELGWAWRDGRWHDAINGYWSPAYPWVLAAALRVVNPSPYWEYPLLHFVNLATTMAALAGFTYLVRGLTARWDAEGAVPRPAFLGAAYALFLWTAVVPLVAWMESPDIFLATFIYLAFGALVRLTSGASRLGAGLVLGLALACGYLTKAAMMPIAVVFFAAAALATWRRGPGVPLTAALVAFLVVAGPWVGALSIAKGRATFGEAGRLNYIWFVNGSENWPQNWPRHWPHWEGEAENGSPTSGARRLLRDPAVYEFATVTPSTYPMWYEPSAWYDGLHAHFDPGDQARRVVLSLKDLYRVFALSPYHLDFFNPQPALAAVFLMVMLVLRALGVPRVFRSSIEWWVPSVAAIAMYTLVYVEQRYLGAFVAAMWLFAFDGLRQPNHGTVAQVLRCGAITMASVLVAAVVAASAVQAYAPVRRVLRGEPDQEHLHWVRAERMRQAGFHVGDLIGYVGHPQAATRWAHLARVRIIAEVPASDAPKLAGSDVIQEQVVAAFRTAGVQWAVWDNPAVETPPRWRRVEGTSYLVRRVN